MVALFLFDLMGAIIKHLDGRYPAQQLSFLRNLFGLVPSLIVLYLSSDWHASGRPVIIRNWKIALMRGGMVAIAQFSYYTALTHMEFAITNTLASIGPIFITALSIPILGMRVGPWRWAAVFIGFAGVIMVIRPGSGIFTLYALFPIVAAFCYASAAVTVRMIDSNVPSATINLYSTFGALVGALILTMSTGGFVPITSFQDWMWIFTMGAVGGCAVILLIMAYRETLPSNLAPFEYLVIPFSFVIGWFFFGEAPFSTLFPGVIFIVGGGLLIIWRERVKKKENAPQEQDQTNLK